MYAFFSCEWEKRRYFTTTYIILRNRHDQRDGQTTLQQLASAARGRLLTYPTTAMWRWFVRESRELQKRRKAPFPWKDSNWVFPVQY
jgi:hypothetical protein